MSLPPRETGPGGDRFPPGAYRANLYVYDPFGRIDWYALVPQSFTGGRYFTIGRGADCDIALDDGAVSARHAFISAEEGELLIRDLRSTNGTTVNGEPLSELALAHGDVVRLGATDIRFLFSYSVSPVQLVLDFLAGPNAGKSVAAYGPSTNIGRMNCAINLLGAGIAPQHVRVDAYGEELLYVVNLLPENETWLNEDLVRGIAPARQGDVLRVGEHVVSLRVVDGDADVEVPAGQGTLQVAERAPTDAADPVARVSASQIRRLEEHLLDHPPSDSVMEAAGLPAVTVPPPAAAPPPLVQRPVAAPLMPPPPMRAAAPRPRNSRDVLLAQERPLDRLAPKPRRPWMWLLVLSASLALLTLAAWVVQLPNQATLRGTVTMAAPPSAAIVSPAAGRVEVLHLKVGATLAPDSPALEYTDRAVEVRLKALEERIKTLEAKPQVERRVKVPVPPALQRELRIALQEREDSSIVAAAAERAFSRREMTLDQVEAARARAERSRRLVYAVQARVDEARRKRVRTVQGGVTEDDFQEIARLVQERETLSKKRRVVVRAGKAGRVVSIGEGLETGAEIKVGEILAQLVSGAPSSSLRVQVPGEQVQAIEAAGTGTLKARGLRPLALRLTRAGIKADPDGTFPMRLAIPEPAQAVLHHGTAVKIEVQLPDRRALLVGLDHIRGWFQ